MSDSNSSLPHRPNVCMLLCNKEKKLFLGERLGEPGAWQFPQGGVDEGTELEANVLRELEEELGAPKKLFRIIQKLSATHTYDFRRVPSYAVGKWRGQTQTFWLVVFLGEDSDIALQKFEPEFSAFRWCTFDETRALAEPIRLPGYLPPIKEAEELLHTGHPFKIG